MRRLRFMRLMPLWLFCTALSWSPAIRAEVESPKAVDLAPILQPYVASGKVPGVGAVVLRGNQIVALGVAGVRKKGAPETIAPDDAFHLGSCTKAMTATVAGIFVDEGKIRW